MKHYELLCVLPGTLSEEEAAPVLSDVRSAIEGNNGKNVAQEDRGKSRLAYPMKHIRYGYVHVFTFEAEPASIPMIQAKLRLITSLLRAMINVFDPSMREEKNKQLAKLAIEKPELKRVEPKDASEDASSEEGPGTGKPTEENMQEIAKKLDKVLDSALEDV